MYRTTPQSSKAMDLRPIQGCCVSSQMFRMAIREIVLWSQVGSSSCLPSGKPTRLWKITINGKTHSKLPFSIAC